MLNMFAPAVALMKRQNYPYKFALVGAGGVAAVLFLLASLLVSLWAAVGVGQRELAGLEVVKPTLRFVQLVQQHRGLTNAVLAGDRTLQDKAAAKELEIAAAIKAVDLALANYGASSSMNEGWAKLKQTWTRLAGDWVDLTRTANLTMYEDLVGQALKFIYATGDNSGLATDPALDSFYLVGMTVYAMPDAIELLGRVGDAGADAYSRKSMTEDQRADFAGRSGVIRRVADDLGSRLDRSAGYNDAIKPTLAKFQESFQAGVYQVISIIDGDFATGRMANPPSYFATKIVAIIDLGYEELFRELLPTIDKLIGARLGKLKGQIFLSLGIALALLGVCAYLSTGSYLAIMGDLAELSAGVKRIGQGDLSARVAISSKDELALVGVGFNAMTEELDSLIGEIKAKTNDIHVMLQNIPQGILTVVANNAVHPEYSAYLEEILQTKEIAGRKVMDLVFSNTTLGSDMLAQLEATMAACVGEDRMNFEFNSHLLISEFDKTFAGGRVKSLELSWSPICNEQDVVEKLMLCVRDVTELKQLAAQAGQQRRELEIIGQILAVNQEKFHAFIDSTRRFIAENRQLVQRADGPQADVIDQLFRNMHTIKGNARTYGLLQLTNLVHEAEQTYDNLRLNPNPEWDADQLLVELTKTHDAVEEYARINEVKLGRRGPGRRGGVEKFFMVEKERIREALEILDAADINSVSAMQIANRRVQDKLRLIGTERIGDVLAGVLDALPSLARELGKEPPRITTQDNGIVVRTQVSDLLKNVFMHLYSNSLDHGLEAAAERIARGKPAAGTIRLDLALDDGCFWLRLRDDGRGLAVAALRRKGIERGLIAAADRSPPEALAQLIFTAGFSTAQQVSEVSGRGVGMDAVKIFVEREGGSIELRFLDQDADADFRPFETVIGLPDKFAMRAAV